MTAFCRTLYMLRTTSYGFVPTLYSHYDGNLRHTAEQLKHFYLWGNGIEPKHSYKEGCWLRQDTNCFKWPCISITATHQLIWSGWQSPFGNQPKNFALNCVELPSPMPNFANKVKMNQREKAEGCLVSKRTTGKAREKTEAKNTHRHNHSHGYKLFLPQKAKTNRLIRAPLSTRLFYIYPLNHRQPIKLPSILQTLWNKFKRLPYAHWKTTSTSA